MKIDNSPKKCGKVKRIFGNGSNKSKLPSQQIKKILIQGMLTINQS
jgi:hypothetical protein